MLTKLPETYAITAPYVWVDNQYVSDCIIEVHQGIIKNISNKPPDNTPHFTWKNSVIYPGFVNAHAHLELTGIGKLPETDFTTWIKQLLKAKGTQSADDYRKSVKQGLNQMMESGVCLVIDHMSHTTPIDAYTNAPISVVIFGELLGLTSERAQNSIIHHQSNQKQSTHPYYLSPHAFYSLNSNTLTEQLALNKTPFSVHLLESEAEHELFTKQTGALFEFLPKEKNNDFLTGQSPIVFWNDLKKPKHALIIHGNYLSENDLNTIATWPNSCIVHCPGSFAYFNHSTFPTQAIRSKNIPVALGTDSITSVTTFSFLDQIRLYCDAQPKISEAELINSITTNALAAIGLINQGKIEIGMQANFTVLNSKTNTIPQLRKIVCNTSKAKAVFCQNHFWEGISES